MKFNCTLLYIYIGVPWKFLLGGQGHWEGHSAAGLGIKIKMNIDIIEIQVLNILSILILFSITKFLLSSYFTGGQAHKSPGRHAYVYINSLILHRSLHSCIVQRYRV